MGAVGLLSYSGYIKAENNLISNCGQYSVFGDLGGRYDFTFNTFVALDASGARKNATVTFTNTPYHQVLQEDERQNNFFKAVLDLPGIEENWAQSPALEQLFMEWYG